MKKTRVPILVVVMLVAFTAAFCSWRSTRAAVESNIGNHEECQYPMRPYVNGNCDNSDPAVPECIKAQNEAECAANYKPPVEEPAAPSSTPAKPTQKCGN